jgi:methylated-DNA-[protein]-cysteine S-methyltransferase
MISPVILRVDRCQSPIGELLMAVDAEGRVCVLAFDPPADPREMLSRCCGRRTVQVEHASDPAGCATALRAYFAGDLSAIDAVPVAPVGTSFQRDVWSALRAIPRGTTTSYGALARALGRPDASRAVGLANGSNPVAIVIPCHRVIGANGSLTGYGGGLERKRWLLAHEAQQRRPLLF